MKLNFINMSNFKISEKVVCVKQTNGLIKGEIYEISSIVFNKNKEMAFMLKSHEFSKHHGFIFQAYFSWRFRKLDYQFGHDICAELSIKYNEDLVEL